MTRGKCAAKAANRLAAFDNKLLVQKQEEVAALKDRMAELESQLQAEKRDRGAVILAEAQKLSEQQVAAAKAEVEEVIQSTAAAKYRVAEWLADYFNDLQGIFLEETGKQLPVVPPNIVDVIEGLVGNDGVGEIMSRFIPGWNSRAHRRLTRDKIRANMEGVRQNRAFNGQSPERTKVTVTKDADMAHRLLPTRKAADEQKAEA